MQLKNITPLTGPHHQVSQERADPILLMLKNFQDPA